MTNGYLKGQRYTRAVCLVLDRWTKSSRGSFRLRPTIVEPLDGWAVKGDVVCAPGIRFPFTVECKNVEDWSLDALFEGRASDIASWWSQCASQAAQNRGRPLLIFSRKRRENYVMLRRVDCKWLGFKPVPCMEVPMAESQPLVVAFLTDLVSCPIP